MAARARSLLMAAGIGALLAGAVAYALRLRSDSSPATPAETPSASSASTAPKPTPIPELPLAEARRRSKHWWDVVAIEPLGLEARTTDLTCSRAVTRATECGFLYTVSWDIQKDAEHGTASERTAAKLTELSKLDRERRPWGFSRAKIAGFSGYVTAKSAGKGGNLVEFHGFRDEPGVGPLKLQVQAADWKWGTDPITMLATVLTTRRAKGATLTLTPPAPRLDVTPKSLAAVLQDDAAGWRAWSDAARTSGAVFNEGAPATAYDPLVAPLQRRLRQYEDGERWTTFALAAPFAVALSWIQKSEKLKAHLELVAQRAQAARRAEASDVPEWSLYQCTLTQYATTFGQPDAVRALAASLREAKAEQMLVEAPEWFGCLASLSWDTGVSRRLDAWFAPGSKLPEKTDLAALAQALGRHALHTETLRRHALWGLSHTTLPDGQSLRVSDHYARAVSTISGSPPVGESSAEELTALRKWLESQPLQPLRAPEGS